jgi:hypothetical protein
MNTNIPTLHFTPPVYRFTANLIPPKYKQITHYTIAIILVNLTLWKKASAGSKCTVLQAQNFEPSYRPTLIAGSEDVAVF